MNVNIKDSVGFATTSSLTVIKEGNGWKVLQIVTQSRTKDGENWEEKEIKSEAFSEDIEEALHDVLNTIGIYLESSGGNLFKESEKGKELVQ